MNLNIILLGDSIENEGLNEMIVESVKLAVVELIS
jgi:hypothetical protein